MGVHVAMDRHISLSNDHLILNRSALLESNMSEYRGRTPGSITWIYTLFWALKLSKIRRRKTKFCNWNDKPSIKTCCRLDINSWAGSNNFVEAEMLTDIHWMDNLRKVLRPGSWPDKSPGIFSRDFCVHVSLIYVLITKLV